MKRPKSSRSNPLLIAPASIATQTTTTININFTLARPSGLTELQHSLT